MPKRKIQKNRNFPLIFIISKISLLSDVNLRKLYHCYFNRQINCHYELQFPVELTIADGFCDMFGRDFLNAGQVRYRSGDFADFVVGTGAQPEFGHRLLQHLSLIHI